MIAFHVGNLDADDVGDLDDGVRGIVEGRRMTPHLSRLNVFVVW